MHLRLFLTLFAFTLTFSLLHSDEVYHPPAFEKIYVMPMDILGTPDGTFYVTPEGLHRRVRTIRRDKDGRTYVILVTQQCPICGRYCEEKTAPDGYCCPFFEREIRHNYWTDH